MRGMLSLYPNVMHWVVRKDAGIKSVADFKGKSIVPAPSRARRRSTAARCCGLRLNYMKDQGEVNVKADFLGYNEAGDLLKNAQTDAAHIAGGVPTAVVIDMMSSEQPNHVHGAREDPGNLREVPLVLPLHNQGRNLPQAGQGHPAVALANILFTDASQPEE
jgi:TRAP-type uncharacterized transport system substrate-binding protein